MTKKHKSSRKSTTSQPSLRMLRVGEEVRHALSMVLQKRDFRDPLLRTSIVTITEVSVSPDIRHARVFIQPLVVGESTDIVGEQEEIQQSFQEKGGVDLSIDASHERPSLDEGKIEQEKIESLLSALNRAEAYLRHQVSKLVHLQHTPKLTFCYDHSFDVYSEINHVLSHPRVQQDLAKKDLSLASGDRGDDFKENDSDSDVESRHNSAHHTREGEE